MTHQRLGWESPYRALSSLKDGEIVHLPTGVKVTKDQLMEMLGSARIVYVSEVHDNIHSHDVQMEILKGISELYPGKVAVGIEMLRTSSQGVADQWRSGSLDEKAFAEVWEEDWGHNFLYYMEILRYIRDNNIPLVALRPPDELVEMVKGAGPPDRPNDRPNDGPNEDKPGLPEMDLEDPYHRAHIEAIFHGHPGGPGLDAFYRAQVLRDEYMAQTAAEYLEGPEGRDRRMLIFAGGYHIEYGFGIPRRVFRRLPATYSIVAPKVVYVPKELQHKLMNVDLPEPPLLEGDFAWAVTYDDLDDQRVFLGVMVVDSDEGARVAGLGKESAAGKAGLQKDDIITALDGEPIKKKFDLTYLLGFRKPGERGVIEVLRDKERLTFDVTFQAHPQHP